MSPPMSFLIDFVEPSTCTTLGPAAVVPMVTEATPKAIVSCSGFWTEVPVERAIADAGMLCLIRTIVQTRSLAPVTPLNDRDHLMPVMVSGKVAVVRVVVLVVFETVCCT